MKVTAVLLLAVLLIACSQTTSIRELEGVRLFEAMNDEVTYTEKVFRGEDAKLFADVVRAECPQGAADEYTRVALEAKASTLILYTNQSGNVTCSVLKPKEERTPLIKNQSEAPQQGVALTVNGQAIMITDVQAALRQEQQQDESTLNLVLNRMINDELLRQEAEGIEVDAEQIAEARARILAAANITEEQLQQQLQRQNATQQFEEAVIDQAKLNTLLEQRLLLDELEVTEQTAREYYLANPNAFLQSEQAVMRHILISAENRSIAQGQERAQMIASLLNSTDFCELVNRYSDDAASRPNCGVYIVPRGVLDPNLELAAFTTPQNQTAVVSTSNGIHFVQTLQVAAAQVVPYNQVAAGLQQDLRTAIVQQRLNLYLQILRADADIVSYLG